MEYSGKLYGKVGGEYFPLMETTEDVEALKKRISELEAETEQLRLGAVRLSLPDSVEKLNLNGVEFTDEEPLFSPMKNSDGEVINGEYGLMLFCRDKRQ